ncbi:MAG: gliding motility-associated C-terminal domain-containing protein [Bacteroidales bacterium]|jgi:gliding motility-associated-like protein
MKYRLFFRKGLMAVLFLTCFLPAMIYAQEGDYTVRIKQPAVDTLRTCPGKTIIFMAEGLNADFSSFDPNQVTFTWDFGFDGLIKTGQNVSFAFPEGGHYTLRLYVTSRTTGPAAKNIPELHVYIAMRPSFEGTRSDQSSICSGSEIGLTGFVTPVPWTKDTFEFENTYAQADFTWNGIGIQSDRNGIARIKPPLNKGNLNYIFRVTDNFTCFHDTTLTLYGVYASFSVTPKTGEAPLEVTMKVDSSSNGGSENSISYDWEFFEITDTAELYTTSETKLSLERPGEYDSRLISRYLQCTNVYSPEGYIKVDSSLLEIPNVFTPNEDGANDYFQVKAVSLKSFSGKIMNRWGRVVFEWTDPKTLEKGWNGRYMNDGKPAPSGTYYYIISATGYDDVSYKGKINEKMYYGFLTLIR